MHCLPSFLPFSLPLSLSLPPSLQVLRRRLGQQRLRAGEACQQHNHQLPGERTPGGRAAVSVLQGLVRARVTLVPARGKANALDQTKPQDQNLSSHGPRGRREEAEAQGWQEARAGRERETLSCKEFEGVSSANEA